MEKEKCAHMGLLDVWVFGWPQTSKTGLPLVTPGRLKHWGKPCRGTWGGVKSTKSTRMNGLKGADPSCSTEPLKGQGQEPGTIPPAVSPPHWSSHTPSPWCLPMTPGRSSPHPKGACALQTPELCLRLFPGLGGMAGPHADQMQSSASDAHWKSVRKCP